MNTNKADQTAAPSEGPQTAPEKCYSRNNEEFTYGDIGELFDAMASDGELKIGQIYYEADCRTVEPKDALNAWRILEDADERMFEEVGEIYDADCASVGGPATRELQELLDAWAAKHLNLGRYWLILGKTREMNVTDEDVRDFA